jgi:hypothetical protein
MAVGAGADDQLRDVGHYRLASLEFYLKLGPTTTSTESSCQSLIAPRTGEEYSQILDHNRCVRSRYLAAARRAASAGRDRV